MAPIGGPTGGGQAGFGSGGSFTGPAEALELVGNHAYAYSGVKTIGGSLSDMIKFTSGNYYFVGSLGIEGEFDDLGSSTLQIQVLFNDSIIFFTKDSSLQDSTRWDTPTPLIIPSYTEVTIKGTENSGNSVNFEALLTGRIYRG
tara:strand:- start:909 stop:1340 length:432 start_codon:yes stop_codon:yes gene_type:complete